MSTAVVPLGRREKRKLEIRARIEEAAYELFKQQGIEETSIEQICVSADVARRTFYGYYPNKHALLGGLGISRLYTQMEPMLAKVMAENHSTRRRLRAITAYIKDIFSGYEDIDRLLILNAPVSLASRPEDQKELGETSLAAFADMIRSGYHSGDVKADFSPEILATTVAGTLNLLTTTWANDSNYPIFDRLEEAQAMFEHLICKDSD